MMHDACFMNRRQRKIHMFWASVQYDNTKPSIQLLAYGAGISSCPPVARLESAERSRLQVGSIADFQSITINLSKPRSEISYYFT
jgi:hypothetical protein